MNINLPNHYLVWLNKQDAKSLYVYDHEELYLFTQQELTNSVDDEEVECKLFELFTVKAKLYLTNHISNLNVMKSLILCELNNAS